MTAWGARKGHGATGRGDRRWPLPPFRADPGSAEICPAGRRGRAAARSCSTCTRRRPPGRRSACGWPRCGSSYLSGWPRPGRVICLDTALWLYAGGPAPPGSTLPWPAPGRTRAAEVSLHAVAYGPGDLWAALPGFAVTSPARTGVDVARVLPLTDAVCALAVLGVATGLRPAHVSAALVALAGSPGVARARRALQVWERLWDGSAGFGPDQSTDQSTRLPVTR